MVGMSERCLRLNTSVHVCVRLSVLQLLLRPNHQQRTHVDELDASAHEVVGLVVAVIGKYVLPIEATAQSGQQAKKATKREHTTGTEDNKEGTHNRHRRQQRGNTQQAKNATKREHTTGEECNKERTHNRRRMQQRDADSVKI